jgi:hypothetical protein
MVLFLFEFCFELSWDPDFSEEGHIENSTQKHSPYLEMGQHNGKTKSGQKEKQR